MGAQAFVGRFSEFDQLAEALSGWDLHWRQLDGGPLRAELAQVVCGSSLVSELTFDRRFFQAGGTPPGMRTFGLPARGVRPLVSCGQPLDDETVFPFPNDYDAISEPGFRANTLSFPEESLLLVAECLGLAKEFERVERSGFPVRAAAPDLAALRTRLRGVIDTSTSDPALLQQDAFRREIEVEIPSLLVRALTSAEIATTRPTPRRGNRRQIASRARLYLEEHADRVPSMEEVCRVVGASLRTLEYAFREHVGVTPKRYLDNARLHRVRQGLREAEPGTRVADVANQWGFWHMGRTAAVYRRQFGELPSETLARSVGSR